MRLSMERLRGLEVVTDAGTAELSVDQLLDEPLEKVRERTVVDTAAVLLLDRGGGPPGRAAPARSPLRRRITEERHWAAIERVDHNNVLNPILRKNGKLMKRLRRSQVAKAKCLERRCYASRVPEPGEKLSKRLRKFARTLRSARKLTIGTEAQDR